MNLAYSTVAEQIKTLVKPLNAQERLAIIKTIAAMDSPYETKTEAKIKPNTTPSHLRRQQLTEEQEKWYARPIEDRQHYGEEFVAVYNGQVVDHDVEQRTLYLRIRQQFGRKPVLIVKADWVEPPVFTIHSTHQEES